MSVIVVIPPEDSSESRYGGTVQFSRGICCPREVEDKRPARRVTPARVRMGPPKTGRDLMATSGE
jgi:hypothetical protein